MSTPRHESGSSLRSFIYLVAHQFTTRILTFTLNLLVARHIGPQAYGLAAVHLYLLNTLILFCTREAVRRATQRYAPPVQLNNGSTSSQGDSLLRHERIVLMNLSWFSILASIPLCIIFYLIFLSSAPTFSTESLIASSDYTHCLWLYTLASFIELLSEPFYVIYQKRRFVKLRVGIDAAAVLTKCVVTFVWMKYGASIFSSSSKESSGGGLAAFGYGQLAFACVVLAGYLLKATSEIVLNKRNVKRVFTTFKDLLPQRLPTTSVSSSSSSSLVTTYSDSSLLHLTTQLTYQSLEKLALTEGEKFVLVSFNSNLDTSGIYGLVQNLGSLIARIIFQPMEESAYSEFSATFAENGAMDGDDAEANKQANSKGRTIFPHDSYTSSIRILGVLLHFVLLLGILLLSYGPSYSYIFIDLFYGVKWSSTDASSILSYYCIYILFMALNGITEAFVSAVISTRELKMYNLFLIVFSAIYLVACIVLLPYGSVGLIASNCVNMTLRIGYSVWFIRKFFSGVGVEGEKNTAVGAAADNSESLLQQLTRRALPSIPTFLAFLASAVITNVSFSLCGIAGSHSLLRFSMHIGVGVVCLVGVAATLWKTERAFIADLKGIARKRKEN